MKADARRIREATERCGRIVHTSLNMARARPAQRGPVALNELVRAAADLLAYTWRSQGITLPLLLQRPLQLAGGRWPAAGLDKPFTQAVLQAAVARLLAAP